MSLAALHRELAVLDSQLQPACALCFTFSWNSGSCSVVVTFVTPD